jgi:acyl-ACP thioesterase
MTPFLEENLTIPSYLADEQAQLSVTSLFKLLQEASDRHAALLGAGWFDLQDRGYFWVLTKMLVHINRFPKWQEEVLLRTWVRASEAATSPRDFEIEDADGNLLVSARAIWAILDTEQGRPQRMDMFDGHFLPQERCALDRRPPKIGPLTLPDTLPEAKTALYSDLDMNHHVNNAHYIQWAFDSVDRDFRMTHRITNVTVNFMSQAKLGEQYTIRSEADSDNTFRTAIVSANEPKEICRLQTEWQTI